MPELRFFASDTKRDLLRLMKRRGTVSLDEFVGATGLTRTTLREHLGQLERDGLVVRSTRKQKQGRGRPSLRYDLTPEGERLFPARDSALLGKFIEFLQRRGEADLLRIFFEEYWDERLREAAQRLAGLDPRDVVRRAEALRLLLQEQGFMPEVYLQNDGIVIRECNCPFPETVRHTRIPCRLEATFFERIFDERIGRVTYIPDGSPACTYEFPEARVPGAHTGHSMRWKEEETGVDAHERPDVHGPAAQTRRRS